MKILLSILIVAAVTLHSQAKTREEMKAKWQTLAAECQKSSGASDDDLEKIITHVKPETHEGKCMIACIFETMGVVSSLELMRTIKFSTQSAITGLALPSPFYSQKNLQF